MYKLLLFAVIGIFAFTSCKKDNLSSDLTNSVKVDQKTISDLKNWFDSHKNQDGSTRRDSFQLPAQIPLWDSLEYYPNDQVYTVPLEKGSTSNPNFLATLVIRVNVNNEIIGAEYTFIKLTDAPENLTPTQVLESYPRVFEFTDMPENFKASMLKYNMDGDLIYSKHYENNTIAESNERIGGVDRLPTVSPDGNGIEWCLDMWWIEYNAETEEILSITWESVGFHETRKVSGSVPICFSTVSQGSSPSPTIDNDGIAHAVLTFNITTTITCLGGAEVPEPKQGTISNLLDPS